MKRLTKLEKEMLCRAGAFALSGEWPWDEGASLRAIRKEERDMNALLSAIDKLSGQS